jgi:hypothetical protein
MFCGKYHHHHHHRLSKKRGEESSSWWTEGKESSFLFHPAAVSTATLLSHIARLEAQGISHRAAAAATWRRTFCISLSCTWAFYTPRAYLYTGVKVENFDATFYFIIIFVKKNLIVFTKALTRLFPKIPR